MLIPRYLKIGWQRTDEIEVHLYSPKREYPSAPVCIISLLIPTVIMLIFNALSPVAASTQLISLDFVTVGSIEVIGKESI